MTEEGPPPFDEKLASTYIGKVMLVGLTYLDQRGTFLRKEQIFGKIASVSKTRGIELILLGVNEGKTYWLPPDLRSTSFAQPGDYTLRETKEVVSDPDLLGTWTIYIDDAK